MIKFSTGMSYLLLGMVNLPTKGLRRFVILPIFFNLLVFIGLFYLLYHYLFPLSNYYVNQLPSWLSFLSTIFMIFFILSCFLFFLATFTIVFNLIAAPFNGILAERAQYLLRNQMIPELTYSEITVRTVKRQMQFISYFFPRFIGMCFLFFIPFIHPFFPFIWFAFNSWILSMQYQDYAMDNNLVDFKTMRQLMRQNKEESFGFGFLINCISFIPILNIVSMPAGVIGGVLMFCDRHSQKLPPILIKKQ
ncbi:sulfate transporter CysZ [Legionella gresilensis]|uniref:sulfate transporter CysZ n=1 Tax=Legionella gresilensis TaxID=91823 RepID=UPI0010412D43|nr:sulfate transporter CysZ [Legionella gresilensis]